MDRGAHPGERAKCDATRCSGADTSPRLELPDPSPAAHSPRSPFGDAAALKPSEPTGPVHTCPVKLRRARRSVSRDSATPRTCRSPREALLRRHRLPVQHSRRRGAATRCYEERAEHRVRRWVLSRESEQQPHAPCVCSHSLATQMTRTRTLVVTRRHNLNFSSTVSAQT